MPSSMGLSALMCAATFLAGYLPVSAASPLLAHTQADDPLVVDTAQGQVRGFIEHDTRKFLGVPFAAPPVGANRFRPPQPSAHWSETRNATSYGKSCLQHKEKGVVDPAFVLDEDCLYLNVYGPSTTAVPEKLLPVMVWIYGGSFIHGTGTFYDGSDLVHADTHGPVLVVNFNYRLGPFGFMFSDALRNENATFKTSGLYGIQDQQAALRWVQQNIRSFGGDPDRVTLFGESAGAISLCVHLALPSSAGLFNRALSESGFCQLSSRADCTARGMNLSTALSCADDNPACLREKKADAILNAIPDTTAGWWPCVDDTEISAQPLALISKGQWNKVPVVAGTNKREDALFICPQYANITSKQYEGLVFQKYGKTLGAQILQLYPVNATDPAWPLITLETDLVFKCPTKWLLDAVQPRDGAWMYLFAHTPDFAAKLGTCLDVPAHSFELPFIFPSLLQIFKNKLSPAEEILGKRMREDWVAFAHAQDPWVRYDGGQGKFIEFNTGPFPFPTGNDFREKQCAFWASLVGRS
jgi:para-nitrobenzyl esterase